MPRDTELVRIRKVRGAATKRLARAASTARRAIYRVQQAQIVIARCDAERQAHEHAGDIEWHRAQLAAARGPAPVPAMPWRSSTAERAAPVHRGPAAQC